MALQEGLAKQKAYEWMQTTVVSFRGEEKSRKQNRCYYGTDGEVQKVPIACSEVEDIGRAVVWLAPMCRRPGLTPGRGG